MSAQDEFETLIIRLIARADELGLGKVERIEVSLQDSGKFPYRIYHTAEQYPYVGEAAL